MARQQVHAIHAEDLLIAVSYHPYAEETLQSVAAAVASGCKVLAISDSLVSPVAKPATLVLQVREAEIRKSRSLSASMCLAQALVIRSEEHTSELQSLRRFSYAVFGFKKNTT